MAFGIQQWNPERWRFGKELSTLQREMDRLFEEFSSEFPRLTRRRDIDFVPACDIAETDNQYLISVDAPGMKKEDLKVELNDETLVVSGSRKEEHKETDKNRTFTERYQGHFHRTFLLPQAGDAAKVEANYCDGVLQIAVPKNAASKAKQIPIGDAKPTPKPANKDKAQKVEAEAAKAAAA